MQKALTQMNVQLANVMSDVVGETGQKILRAIVAGERDGHVLAVMKNARIRASVVEIAKSMQGNWRTEHLFALKQAIDAFDFVGRQVAEDQALCQSCRPGFAFGRRRATYESGCLLPANVRSHG